VVLTHIDSPPTLSGVTVSTPAPLYEGSSIKVTGSLTDPDSGQTLSLSISWGDGTTDNFANVPQGTFNKAHAYQEEGTYSITLTASDGNPGGTTSVTLSTAITDAVLSDASQAQGYSAAEGVSTGDLVVAAFSDADPEGAAGDYTATVHWGDGLSSAGTVQPGPGGIWQVHGSHAYAEEGGYAVRVDVADAGGAALSAIGQAAVQVSDAVLADASAPLAVSAAEGASTGDLVLAAFSDADPAGTQADYSAVVHWGDGQSSPGSVQPRSGGGWEVHGSHGYAEEGSYAVTVDVADAGGAALTGIGQTAVHVTDAALADASAAATAGAVEGASTGDLVLASFSDSDPAGAAGDYTATVQWGDGQSGAAAVQAGPNGSWQVHAAHAYAGEGSYAVTVAVQDAGGAALAGIGQVTVQVTDAALADASAAATASAAEGAGTGDLVLAAFGDADPGAAAGDYTATVRWGDGQSSAGTVQPGPNGTWRVHGSHAYAEEGSYAVTADIADAGGASLSGIGQTTVQVADGALADASTPATASAAEGAGTGDLVLAAFTDADPAGAASDYSATVSWGDGLSSPGAVQAGPNGTWQVHASHAYAEEGSYAPSLTLTDAGGAPLTGIGLVTIQVANAALSDASVPQSFSAAEGAGTGDLVVAAFSDADPGGSAGDFGATIHWGDGQSSAGTVVPHPGGGWEVHGSHAYAEEGGYAVRVDVADAGGAALTAIGQAAVQVGDAALADASAPLAVSAAEGAPSGDLILAAFTDADPPGSAADYTATVSWGDGQTSPGIIQPHTGGGWEVHAAHTYGEEGAFAVTVAVGDAGGASLGGIGQTVVQVADATLSDTTTAQVVSATEGANTGDLVLATFADPDPAGAAADYSATVHWGDGQSSPGNLQPAGGRWQVHGFHTYAEEGSYAVTVDVGDSGGAALTAIGQTAVQVSDATLTDASTAATAGAVEGAPTGDLLVAAFTDADPGGSASDYKATVSWGDGQTSPGTVQAGPGGIRGVYAGHAYAEEGSYAVTVAVQDAGGAALAGIGGASVQVADAALSDTSAAATASAVEGAATGDLVLASFTDADPGTAAADYTAIVHWGDGQSSAGTVQPGPGGTWQVRGSHAYAEEGSYAVTADIADAGGAALSAIGLTAIQVSDAALADTSQARSFAAVEGASTGDLVLAAFTDADPAGVASDYTATVYWGDGQSSPGAVQAGPGGTWLVHAAHAYAEEGSYAPSVTVADAGGAALTGIGMTAVQVADAALADGSSPATLSATLGATTGDAVLAVFTDADPAGAAGDYSATVHWGDGSASPGTVQAHAGGGWEVHGAHSYSQVGTYAVTVDVADAGAAKATGIGQTTVQVAGNIQVIATVSGPTDGFQGVQGQTRTFTLGATASSPANQAAGFTYFIHWADGSADQTVTGPSGTSVSHVFGAAGSYTVTVTATDQAGVVRAPVSLLVTILVAEVQGGTLMVGGTAGNDTFVFNPGPNPGDVAVTVDNVAAGTFHPASGQIRAFGYAGTNTATFNGTTGTNTFAINTAAVTVNGTNFRLDGFNSWTVNGVGTANTFTITGAGAPATLVGGSGTNTFALNPGASIQGTVTGGSGTNTLDYSAYGQAVTVNLQSGTATGLAGFSGIQVVAGSAALTNTLTGPGATALWQITGKNAGAAGGVTFTGFENLVGTAGADTFQFLAGGNLSGSITGGGGADWLDYSQFPTGVTVNLTSGTATGVGGGVSGIANVAGSLGNDTLVGGAGAGTLMADGGNDVLTGDGSDTIVLAAAQGSGTVVTGAGTDTLVGGNVNSTWSITGAGKGTVGAIPFTGIANLTGGSGNDSFKFGPKGSVAGTVDGGAGTNTLDYSGDGGIAATVDLQAGAATATATGGFTNIQTLVGSTSTKDTLIGPSAAVTWKITAANAGKVSDLTFSAAENLVGGTGADTFQFGAKGSLSGSINGGGGGDWLNYAQWKTAVTVNLATGAATGVAGGVVNIANVAGGTGTDTLTGGQGPNNLKSNGGSDTLVGDGDDTIQLAGTQAAGTTVTGAGTDTLVGGPSANTWNITGAGSGTVNGTPFTGIANLTGGAGNNTFKFGPGGSVTGKVSGGAGTNTLDYSGNGGAVVTVNLQNNCAPALGSFGAIQALVGSSAPGNTLVGAGGTNTWQITGANAGKVGTLTFSAIANLTGGTGADTFQVLTGGSLSGGINGGGGADWLDYSQFNTGVTVNLATGSATGVAGGAAGAVSNIANVAGSPYNDTLTAGPTAATLKSNSNGGNDALSGGANTTILLSAKQGAGTIVTGKIGHDTLVGAAVVNLWNVTGANSGTVNGIPFTGIAYLTGGSSANTFKFGPQGSLTDSVSGGAGTGTLDFSGFGAGAVTVNLQNSTATAVNGFFNIQKVIGNSATATLVGPSAATVWQLTGLNAGSVAGAAFSAFPNLKGGPGMDSFQFLPGGGVSGTINGGGGGDWLDYSALTTAVVVNFTTGSATGVARGVSNMQNVIGGQGKDTLAGNAQGNILIGGAGTNVITGGSGRSLLIGGSGPATVTGGSGDDILVGGTTSLDGNEAALLAILSEWQSANDYATRVSHIRGTVSGGLNNGFNLSAATVTDSAFPGTLLGGAGLDWFWANLALDTTDAGPGEQVN
jgi:hypothetical protein